MTIAFDTNVYAYTLDTDAPLKRDRAIELLASQTGSADESRPLLWQVACEFLAFLRRQQEKKRIDEAGVTQEVDGLLANHRLVTPTTEIIPRSLDLKSRYSLSHWDSLLIAACTRPG